MAEKNAKTSVGNLTPEMLSREIKKGILGAFVFYGEEDFLKSHYRDEIYKSVIEEGFEVFNYYAISFSPAVMTKEDALSHLADAVLAVPMMQDKKYIVVSDLAPATLGKDLLDSLCSALETASRSDDTVVVLYCRSEEMETDYKLETTAYYKKLAASAHMVRFDLQPRGKLISWVKRHFSAETILMTDEAAGLLVDYCAGRMTSLSFEIEKLLCYAKYVKGGEPPVVDVADVQRIASVYTGDEVPFAMLNAAQSWKLTEMLTVLDTAKEQREEPISVLARLSRIYLDMLFIKTAKDASMSTTDIAKALKMKEFRVEKYIAAITRVPLPILERAVRLSYETDRALKSAPSDAWVLLDRLAVEIYAPKSLR